MTILAIDTSTLSASLALYDGERLLYETTWRTGRKATAQLHPVIGQCFDLSGRGPADLGAVAVALGPGSFNGLRVGLSTAKALAYSLEVPILGLPTPDIVAYPFSADAGTGLVLPVCAILQAGRGRVVSARFQTRYGRWQQIASFRNTTLEEVCQATERATVFCGEIGAEMAAYLREQLGQRALIASTALSARRAGYLAEMAWKRLQEEPQGDDLATLQPIYLSRPRIGGAPPAQETEETA